MTPTRLSFLLLGLFMTLLPASQVAAADRPVRLLAEAEDFRVEKGPWKVVPFRENYFASTFAISFLSRMACLGAPAQVEKGQEAVAVQEVDVPSPGEFSVLARYEQPFNFSVEFTVEVLQGGKSLFQQTFGKLDDPKVWALNGHKRVPMERYGWGGTDNIVWQEKGPRVKLNRGKATLRLVAGPQLDGGKPRPRAARRHVDVICLTNDTAGIAAQKKTSYLEFDGWLVQDGDLFVRFTNPKGGLGPCVPVVAPEPGGQHSPYYVHVRDWPTTHVLKSGRIVEARNYTLTGPRSTAVKPQLLAPALSPARFLKPSNPKDPKSPPVLAIPESEYLQPGQTSGWVPMGQVLDALHNCTWQPRALYRNRAAGLHLELEFAVPDGKGGLRSLRKLTLTRPETFEMPGNVAPNADVARALEERFWLPQIRTQREAVEWLLGEVKKFPNRGPIPKRFLVYGILGFGGRGFADPNVEKLAVALGDNIGTTQAAGKKRQLAAHWPDPSLPAIKKMEAARKGGFGDLLIVSYGDEIHLPALPVTDAEFKAWLKERGVKYSGVIEYVQIKPGDTPAQTAAKKAHPLWYYSQICAKEKGARHFAAGTAYYRSKGVLTGANYSPHANYLVTEMDYIRPFKLRAMSMPWSEDYVWQIPEFSVQATGYLTSGLRAGAKYDNLPIHMYVMPHSPGNTPRDFRLSFYTAVAHGAKHVDYFCASPLAIAATENYIATDDLPMWRQVHACTHEAGTFEDFVVDGKVRPGKVGLLLSSVDEVMTGVNNFALALHNNERKALYYALRHSQVPVDFLSEDDLIDGRAADYRVIYVGQQWLHSRALEALQKWAEKGGTVVAVCGGGFRDEFNRANPKAGAFYGVKSQKLTVDPNLVSKYLLKENQPFLTKQDLPAYEPMDRVTWASGKGKLTGVPVVVWKQVLEPADAKVIGTYADGKPAVLEKKHGKGRVVLFGFLPGQAYLKSALPLLPADRGSTDQAFAHFLPTKMDVKLRQALVDDFLPAGFVRPVECSEPLVESTCIDTPAGGGKQARLAVPLMNFTGKPIAALTVRLNGLAGVKSIRSVQRGKLKAEVKDGSTVVRLPLDVADMLLVER